MISHLIHSNFAMDVILLSYFRRISTDNPSTIKNEANIAKEKNVL